MISSIGYNSNNNVSFGGIVKIKAVILNDTVTCDKKTIDKGIKIVKKILMKNCTTPNTEMAQNGIRTTYKFFDKDYIIPAGPVKGDTRQFFTHVQAGQNHYFLTGDDAARLDSAGIKLGHAKKAAKVAKNTEFEDEKEMLLEIANTEYGSTIEQAQQKYWRQKGHPEIAIFMRPNAKGKTGLSAAILGNDSHKLNILDWMWVNKPKVKAESKPLKKLVQTDFLDKLA